MDLIKTRGIILKALDYKEKDRLLYIFTADLGKITVIARGVRSAKGRYQAAVQPMTLCDFVLFPGKNIHMLIEAETIHSFPVIKSDYEKITYGSYFLELTDIAMADREPQEQFFADLVKALFLLDQAGIQVKQLARAFEIKTLLRTGNQPDPVLANGMTETARKCVWIMLNKPLEEALELNVREADLETVGALTDSLLRECFQRRPKSLDLLDAHY